MIFQGTMSFLKYCFHLIAMNTMTSLLKDTQLCGSGAEIEHRETDL